MSETTGWSDRIVERKVLRRTLTTQLEDALRVDIIVGVLRPGQRLRTFELTDRYGVSATPLREALQRLAAQNLVDIDPHLGATVAGISQTDLRDIYDLREILESTALEQSIARADERWERQLTDTWKALRQVPSPSDGTATREDAITWSAAHRAFHEALFEACGSPWLVRFIRTLYDHSERYRMLSVWSASRDNVKEHDDIFQSAILRASPGAVAALRRHLERTVELLERNMLRTAGSGRSQAQEEEGLVANEVPDTPPAVPTTNDDSDPDEPMARL